MENLSLEVLTHVGFLIVFFLTMFVRERMYRENTRQYLDDLSECMKQKRRLIEVQASLVDSDTQPITPVDRSGE